MNNLRIARCFINQPSTLQPMHKYHGLEAICVHKTGDVREIRTIYPTTGDTISMEVPKQCLSYGWPSLKKEDT